MDQIVNGLRDILQYVIGLAGLVAVGFILYGGFKYMSSRDDPRAVAGARTTLINATIGLDFGRDGFPPHQLGHRPRRAPTPRGSPTSSWRTSSSKRFRRETLGNGTAEALEATSVKRGTVKVVFSAPICVEGQGNNLKLRTDRGNMNLVAGQTATDCEAEIAKQKPEILFQIENDSTDAWLAELTVSAFQKSGNVAIVSPAGAPVIDDLSTTYTCTWKDGATAPVCV